MSTQPQEIRSAGQQTCKANPTQSNDLLDWQRVISIICFCISALSRKYPLSNHMKTSLITGIAAVGCVLMASCYPYPEPNPHHGQRKPDGSVSSAEQQKLQEQRDKLKEKEQQAQNPDSLPPGPQGQTTPSETPKPAETKRAEYQFAAPVPGKPGMVFSPYNNKVVDVRDIPSGTLVQDPTYPAEQKKYFRVP